MSFTSSAVTSTSMQQEQHGLPGPDLQNREKPLPATGKQADHPSLYQRPAGIENAIRSQLANAPGNGSAGKATPRAASGTHAPDAPGHLATKFQEALSAPHISLLKNQNFRNTFVHVVDELGKIAVKGAKTALQSPEWKSGYRYYAIATWLNDRCGKNLSGHSAEMAASLGPHIVETARTLSQGFKSIQVSRGLNSRLRTILAREDAR